MLGDIFLRKFYSESGTETFYSLRLVAIHNTTVFISF